MSSIDIAFNGTKIAFLTMQVAVLKKYPSHWHMIRAGWCSTGSIGDEVKTRLSPAFANLGQRSPTQPWETLAIMLPALAWHFKAYARNFLVALTRNRVEIESAWPALACNCAADPPKRQRWSKELRSKSRPDPASSPMCCVHTDTVLTNYAIVHREF